MIIYKLTNKINNKIYVGMTKYSVGKRVAQHIKSKKKTIIQNAINKYGIDSFIIEIIDSADTREALAEKEKYWIKKFNCKAPLGYNATDGGEGVVGSIQKVRDAISSAKKGISLTEEHKQALRKPHKMTEEGLAAILLANTGEKHSKETKKKMSLASKGKPKSKEHAENISKGKTGHFVSEEQKEKQRIAMTGKKHSEETKKKMSASGGNRKGKHLTPEQIQNRTKRNKQK